MHKSVAFHNLGCKVNSYETEKMMKELAENGYSIVPFDQKADIYIVNTCSVTNIADRKSRQMLHRAKALNPSAVIVAAGCYVDTRGEKDVAGEGVDICVRNDQKKDIVPILEEYFADKEDGSGCTEAVSFETADFHTRRFIKVQDGCDMFCSYCIIPFARGRIASRTVEDVISETKEYVRMGYREFVPTGIHISSYGKDRPDDGEGLIDLVRAMSEIEGVKRIRLSSLEPGIVTESFAEELFSIRQLCPHFHLSLQSGSDTVLKRMNRHYSTDGYMKAVEILRDCFDDPAITTDIITGFPGETEEEFRNTLDFVERVGFYETHVFKYSRRKGTAADRMPGQITERVKHERSRILLELDRLQRRRFEDRRIENRRVAEVLLEDTEETDERSARTGYTRDYIKVYDPEDGSRAGEIVCGTLERAGDRIIIRRQ